jgi:hypothetical protein
MKPNKFFSTFLLLALLLASTGYRTTAQQPASQSTAAGGMPGMKVSWQVTGVRSGSTARKYKFDIEEEKPERERDYYLNPDAFGQSEEKIHSIRP